VTNEVSPNVGMSLAVLGAGGRTGRLVVAQALRAGHVVRALSRSPAPGGVAEGATMIGGDVRDEAALVEVLRGAEAVVSCLGVSLGATLFRHRSLLAPSMQPLLTAMRRHGPRRLIVLSTYGAGDSWARLGRSARFMMATLLRRELADKNQMEALVTASDLDWTIVRPVNLRDTSPSGRWLVNPLGPVGLGSWISRADVAAFMLATLVDTTSVRRAYLLSRP
jgi:uncharacterized protein YbjT (DUF2867 family)